MKEKLIPSKTIKEDGSIVIRNGIKNNPNNLVSSGRKPKWLKVNLLRDNSNIKDVAKLVKRESLNTVCEEAMCPNINECWSHGTATFMLLGSTCTRACKFCAVDTGNPRQKLDKSEPAKVAKSVKLMNLKYVVLTSVNRDDLTDGGALHYSDTVKKIKELNREVIVEALTPDFCGSEDSIDLLLDSGLQVFAQNVETVKRLTNKVRDPRAGYYQSLKVLSYAKESNPQIITKTSLMLGLGETDNEILETMQDIREHGVDVLTMGQYLRPTLTHLPVKRWVNPIKFKEYKILAEKLGFKEVASGPLVRSSYRADKIARIIKSN